MISRIKHAIESEQGLAELHGELIATLNEIIAEIEAQSGIGGTRIAEIVLTGNSVMLHALHREDMRRMSALPFEPAFRSAHALPARELGLALHAQTQAYSFPIVAGFVGGDTVACVLAEDMDTAPQCQMIVDIGTNGEVALGCRSGWITASAPAGPAFEGATISCGMRAADGAVEHVRITSAAVELDVIGKAAPRGICGTGLIDAAAALLDCGLLDETGRLLGADELPVATPEWLARRVLRHRDALAFILFDPRTDALNGNGNGAAALYLTQRDFRELQLAKAAVASACDLLLRRKGLGCNDLGRVNLAGAFGNFLRPAQARRIGLLPPVPLEKVRFVGNAASTGAKRALVSRADRRRAEHIAQAAEHVELAADPEFQNCFAEHLLFPPQMAETINA